MDTNNETNDLDDPKLVRAGEAVARLSHPTPPSGLAARTMARISSSVKPVSRVFWMLRPITNPLARIAAAACIIYMLFPMTDVDLGSRLGMQIEQNITGHAMTDRVENLVNGVLSGQNFTADQSAYPSFLGVQGDVHVKHQHSRGHSGT